LGWGRYGQTKESVGDMNKTNMAVHPTGNGADTKVATSGQGTYCDRDASPISTNGLRLMAAANRANRARLAVYQMEWEGK